MKSKISVHDRATLASEIAALAEATPADLKSRWRALYSTEPPRRISRDLLTRAVAYRIQEKALGGLKPSTRRLLARVAADASARRPIQVTPAPTLTPGTVLLREWHGTQHQVIVREHGIEFQGKRYKSLSQVAHRITGSKWSGPLFFGLKAKRSGARRWSMSKARARRCAIYTRKSSEEGLEQDFNSLHAQREACEAFIKSQASEGWKLIKTAYDDGGLSGGTMERPALQRLLADIGEGLVDVVVVYKVDRLTRSLADFAKMVEMFDAHGVSFVAVTQQFNTTTSMGRLTLNVLLSFAQFEREVTGERIRDKIAASKRKGMWMGGVPPLGYDVRERRLVVNPTEANTVRYIYERYLELGCVRQLSKELDERGIVSKVRISKKGIKSGGCRFSRGALYELLANPIYIGEIRHKQERYPGQHEAIVPRELWERVQQRLARQCCCAAANPRPVRSRVPLAGKIFDADGEPLYAQGAAKAGRRYRYYVSRSLVNGSVER